MPVDDSTTPVRGSDSRSGWLGRRTLYGVLVFLSCVFVMDSLVGERGLLAVVRIRQQYHELAAEVARARAENARLREQARRLREDPAAIEEIARRELGLIRPGETLFIVRDVPAARPAP
jgi:cell division protein FtsB